MKKNYRVNFANLSFKASTKTYTPAPMGELSVLINQTVAKYREKVLLTDFEHSWTGREIEEKINQLEKYLGVTTLENSLVGICFPNLAVQGLAILAVIKAKRVPVILSYADLVQQPQSWFNRVHLDLLLTTVEFEKKSQGYVNTLALHYSGEIAYNQGQSSPLRYPSHLAPKGTGLVLYTSGSTGNPKGICVPDKGIVMTCDYLIDYFNLDESTVTPIILPVCHSMALNTQFFPTFLSGGTSAFVNSRLEMNKLYRYIVSVKGNFIALIGDILRVCWDEMKVKSLPPCYDVKHVQLAGGIITEKHLQMAAEMFPNATVHKGYGLTEGIRVTMIDHNDELFLKNVVGKALPFQQIEIRTSDGRVADVDEMGEVFVKGPNVMLGILESSQSPVGEDGFLQTGDMGSLNQKGQLSIFGRKDGVFKINGLKVSGMEIEKIAIAASDYIREAKCILIEDHKRVKNKIILFLEIPLNRQNEFYQNYVENFHKALWEQFKSLSYFPKDIIVMQRFPRTNNGKLSIKGLHLAWEQHAYQKRVQESYGRFSFYNFNELTKKDNLKDVQ